MDSPARQALSCSHGESGDNTDFLQLRITEEVAQQRIQVKGANAVD